MIRDGLTKITLAIAALGIVFLCLSLWLSFTRPSTIPPLPAIQERVKLPEKTFPVPEEGYQSLGEHILSLKSSPVTLQIPDLRQQLIYYGKNGRPDAQEEKILLNFGLPGSKATASVAPGEKLYIAYDRSQKPAKFIFSPNNEQTTLWLEAAPHGSEADVKMRMINESGKVIQTPPAHANFRLKEKDQTRIGKAWDIGKWRVDATLLSRQKARWFGQDTFLERHGGEEYEKTIGRERIDFTEDENPYSVFAKEGDALIWCNNHWQEAIPGEETVKYPLLIVKKVNDRVMNLELWDVEGKGKINLNLLKSADAKIPPGIAQNFKFVGAKTRSQFLFEINKERMTLKPKDWLLLTKKGWVKLTTPEQIDDYVNRKTTGPLFVFDGMTKKGDAQIIAGTLYNASRTEVQPIELPVQQSRATAPAKEAAPEEKNAPPAPPQQPPPPGQPPGQPPEQPENGEMPPQPVPTERPATQQVQERREIGRR